MKDVHTKSQKITLFTLAQPPLSVRKHQKISKNPIFCAKKCGRPHLTSPLVRKMSALDKPLLWINMKEKIFAALDSTFSKFS